MRKNLVLTALLAMSLTAGAQNYDVNRDGRVNVVDLAVLINYIISPMSVNPPKDVVAVDLGLPSGTKWANMNVGATSPEDYGLFFAWGETTGYTSDTSDGHSFDWESYKWGNGRNYKLTKYCASSSYGTMDNKTTLDPEDDAAHVKWGGSWYMPTYDEMGELFNYTNYEWVNVNGVNGCKFTASNGNSIFLPAAGDRYYSSLRRQGECGYYWLSSLYKVTPTQAREFYFDSGTEAVRNNSRHIGLPVRPVLR
jgi:hypothetical protein